MTAPTFVTRCSGFRVSAGASALFVARLFDDAPSKLSKLPKSPTPSRLAIPADRAGTDQCRCVAPCAATWNAADCLVCGRVLRRAAQTTSAHDAALLRQDLGSVGAPNDGSVSAHAPNIGVERNDEQTEGPATNAV